MKFKKQGKQGFTIVEIMIALTIGLFLVAGVTQVFLSTNQTSRVHQNLSRMQENARFAMLFLARDIRKAGLSGRFCGKSKDMIKKAYNGLNSTAAKHKFNDLAAVGGKDGGTGSAPDEISIRFIENYTSRLNSPTDLMSGPSGPVVVSSGLNFEAGNIVIITDCQAADIFQITVASTSGDKKKLGHAVSGAGPPGNKTASLSKAYGSESRVIFLAKDGDGVAETKYSVEVDKGAVGLRRGTQQMVANIENMQILYGQASGGETAYLPAGGIVDMEKVVSVRISLLVRSPDDNLVTPRQAYTFNGVTVSGAGIPDNRIRRVYTSTVALRNRLP